MTYGLIGGVVLVVIMAYVIGYISGLASRRMNPTLRAERDTEWDTMVKLGKQYNVKPKRGEGVDTFRFRLTDVLCARKEGCVGKPPCTDV